MSESGEDMSDRTTCSTHRDRQNGFVRRRLPDIINTHLAISIPRVFIQLYITVLNMNQINH